LGAAIGVTVGVLAVVAAGIIAFVVLIRKKAESSSNLPSETGMTTEPIASVTQQWDDVENMEHDFLNPMDTGIPESEEFEAAFLFSEREPEEGETH
jgi:hypothetical protein